jgi:hypothetical protein
MPLSTKKQPPQLYLDKYCTCMLTSSLIVSHQSLVPPCLHAFRPLSRHPVSSPCLPTPLPHLLHQSPQFEVTKSPVVHPLSVQQLTKCSSPKSFVLITIHFDGGCTYLCTYPPSALLLFFEEPIRALTHYCKPRANRMPTLLGSSVAIRGGRRYSRTGERETGTRQG